MISTDRDVRPACELAPGIEIPGCYRVTYFFSTREGFSYRKDDQFLPAGIIPVGSAVNTEAGLSIIVLSPIFRSSIYSSITEMLDNQEWWRPGFKREAQSAEEIACGEEFAPGEIHDHNNPCLIYYQNGEYDVPPSISRGSLPGSSVLAGIAVNDGGEMRLIHLMKDAGLSIEWLSDLYPKVFMS